MYAANNILCPRLSTPVFYLFDQPANHICFASKSLWFYSRPRHIEPIWGEDFYRHALFARFFLPADSLLPGHILAREAKCCSSGKMLMSLPGSAKIYCALSLPTPGIVDNSLASNPISFIFCSPGSFPTRFAPPVYACNGSNPVTPVSVIWV